MGTVGRTEHGYKLEAEIGKSLERYGNQLGEDDNGKLLFFYQKLVDTKLFEFGLYCNHCHHKVKHNLIIPKTIADYICALPGGQIWFIEAKSSEQTSFPIGNIADHQIFFARTLENLNVPYWFVLQHVDRSAHERRSFAISGLWLIELINEVETKLKRKSIPWDMLEKRSIELQWLGYGLWTVEDIFGTVEEVLAKAGITRKVESDGKQDESGKVL